MTEFYKNILKGISERKISLSLCEMINDRKIKVKNNESGVGSGSEILFADLLCKNNKNFPVILKIWLNIPGDEDEDKENYNYKAKRNRYGLRYEVNVYRKIIKTILIDKYSPNFVSYIGYAECPFQGEETLNKMQISGMEKYWVIRHMKCIYGEKFLSTPGITISMLMTERIKNTTSIRDFLQETNEREKEKVIFMVIFSIAVMRQFRLNHHDLHYNNILLSVKEKEQKSYYRVGKKVFLISTKFIPYLYDWDIAFAKSLGPNKKLEQYSYQSSDILNKFVDERIDLMTFFCFVLGFQGIAKSYYKDIIKQLSMTYPQMNKRIERTEDDELIYPVTKTEVKKLRKQPLMYDRGQIPIYKLSSSQIRDIFNERTVREFFLNSPLDSVIVKLLRNIHDMGAPSDFEEYSDAEENEDGLKKEYYKNYFIKISPNVECRYTAFTKDMPTALKLLLSWKGFKQFLVDPDKLDPRIPVYTLPEKVVM